MANLKFEMGFSKMKAVDSSSQTASMRSTISIVLDREIVNINFAQGSSLAPTTTVLNYLRQLPNHKGVKEACAEGDCGACTVVIGELATDNKVHYTPVDSCLVFLPMLHGKQLITVENLKADSGNLHPVQAALVQTDGSQCGFCTPGIVMSLFALYKSRNSPSREDIDDALTGNLCRCTGYQSIVEAAAQACAHGTVDHLSASETAISKLLGSISRDSIVLDTGIQRYFRPATLGEAISLKHQYPDAVVLCGGTDVALRVTKNHELLSEIIDISGVGELQSITVDDVSFRIGAGVVLSVVESAVKEEFPALHRMLTVFGSWQIRNLATLGGNLGTASPIGDILPVLIAYNARVVLRSVRGEREVAVDRFLTGYRSSEREDDELVTAVIIPKAARNVYVRSYKVSKRKDLDISTISGAFRLELNDDRVIEAATLAYGGMAERAKRAEGTEKFLGGKQWDRETVSQAMRLIDNDFTPISDVRGSAESRRIMARNLLMKCWSETNQ